MADSHSARVTLPDWKSWLEQSARLSAGDPEEYQLHLAAHEWLLSHRLSTSTQGTIVRR